MTALRSPAVDFATSAPVAALRRAEEAEPAYCTVKATDLAHARLREMTALEVMYAYFGSDEAAA